MPGGVPPSTFGTWELSTRSRRIPFLFIFLRTLFSVNFPQRHLQPFPFLALTDSLLSQRGWPTTPSPFRFHGPRVTPLAPLQPNAFGATIRKGARILHDPGKQLRSPRCLRIRERTSGTARSWSPLEVVPGSMVLTVDRSRVARATHPRRMVG